ncbi:hypothetical protein SELMODRAFT_413370 [Selaginella moellendorffii]|uniref:Armadillo repeat-containing domain-containing protein n=1 Tax=Selaginella moellendorffii TaxID=88036 RepID=D8RP85_SELML|nr:uncharacterized protein LOC9637444 [Selaginella moellendorffii]EFJ25991.1 hypothetical protein SELMODRAFT_413370 [Selaginella moellendorffii]|eukprot:XP_002972770.1 uncharacterized protein LOC9637444 [Selaginella moellendorffii]
MAAVRSICRLGAAIQGWHRNLIAKIPVPKLASEFKPPPVNEFGETNARPGWLRVSVTAAFLGYMSMNAIPIIAEGTVKHPVLLLKVKDPFFQRSGASRLIYLTLTDGRKQAAVKYGAIGLLLEMLESATDDKTRIAALKAMNALAQCDLAIKVLHRREGGAALEKMAESTANLEILSLITSIQDKMRRPLVLDEEDDLLVATPALAMS